MQYENEKLNELLSALKIILEGEKVFGGTISPQLFKYLSRIFLHLHHQGDIGYEPRSLLVPDNTVSQDNLHLGITEAFPPSVRHIQAAQIIVGALTKPELSNGQKTYPQIRFIGLFEETLSHDFQQTQEQEPLPIYFASHIPSLVKLLELIQSRIGTQGEAAKYPPVIVFDPLHIMNQFIDEFAADLPPLENLGIFSTSSEQGAIARIEKYEPLWAAQYPIRPVDDAEIRAVILATTDPNKRENMIRAVPGGLRAWFLNNVFGKMISPPEETLTYVGNAAAKFEASLRHILSMLDEDIKAKLRATKIDPAQTLVAAHDGGLGFCLEKIGQNGRVIRATDIFDPEIFASVWGLLPHGLMMPGVELGPVLRSLNTDVFFKKLHESVAAYCNDPQRNIHGFTPDDLRAYDSVTIISISLEKILKLRIREGDIEDKIKLVISQCRQVYGNDIFHVSQTPQGVAYGSEPSTQHYLQRGQSRDSIGANPRWRGASITARVTRALLYWPLQRDAQSQLGDLWNCYAMPPQVGLFRANGVLPLNWLQLAQIDHAFARHPLLKSLRRAYPLSHSLGKYLRNYTNIFNTVCVLPCHSRDFIKNIRKKILEQVLRGGVHYFGPLEFPRYVRQYPEIKTFSHLAMLLYLCRAVVSKQLQHDIRIVVSQPAYKNFFDHVSVLQSEGLLTPDLSQLMHVSPTDNATDWIMENLSQPREHSIVTPLLPYMQDQIDQCQGHEDKNIFTVSVYCSATNNNTHYWNDLYELGKSLAEKEYNMKVGGGNEGLMRAAAQGFIDEKRKLPGTPHKLIICQYTETLAIEGLFKIEPGDEEHTVIRVHKSIEDREQDLARANLEIAAAGGLGTTMEMLHSILKRASGDIDPATQKLILMGHARDEPHEKWQSVHREFVGLIESCGIELDELGIMHVANISGLPRAINDAYRASVDTHPGMDRLASPVRKLG